MKYKKITISLFMITILLIMQFSVICLPANAALVYPNKYTYIRNSPYWISSVVDQFGTSQGFTLIERDGKYIYIEYTKNGVKKRGYMPLADITNPSISWCNHTEYNPGNNKSGTSIVMRYGPGNDFGQVTTVSSSAGSDSNPLLILRVSGTWAFIQIVSNYTETSYSVQPQYTRGWVPVSSIDYNRPTAESYLKTGRFVLIKNQSTGKYLTAIEDSTASNGWRAVLQDSTGYSNQIWKIIKCTQSTGAVYYKIQSRECDLYLHVQDSLPTSGALIQLKPLSDPNKAQEFHFKALGESKYNGTTIGMQYQIRTRVTGSYQCFSVSDENTVESRVISTSSGVWSIEAFDRYWSNSYINLPKNGNTKIFKYYVYNDGSSKDVVKNTSLSMSQIESAVNRWNNISTTEGNIYVQLNRTTSLSEALIKVYLEDIGKSAQGKAIPSILIDSIETQGPNGEYRNNNWYGVHVKLNSNSTPGNSFEDICYPDGSPCIDAKQGVICHEFGHALKLAHPYGSISQDSSGNYTFLEQLVYSVMTPGVYASSDADSSISEYMKVSYTPTIYDRFNLINKWGDY